MNAPTPHLSAFAIDALALGALAPNEAAQASRHLAECERCQKEADGARAAREHFRGRVYLRTLPRLRARVRSALFRRPLTLSFLLGPVIAAALIALIALPGWDRGEPEFGVKGGPAMKIFVRHDGRVTELHEGAALSARDELRFAIAPTGLPYLLIASVDGEGKPSVYFPLEGGVSGRLQTPAQAQIELPGSIILDAAPGPERIFALFSAAPLPVAEVITALRELGARGAAAIRVQKTLPVSAQAQLSLVFEKR